MSDKPVLNSQKKTIIESYEESYTFFSAQVLMEINRFVVTKKLSRNQENIEAEVVLRDAIIHVLERFSVHDIRVPVEMAQYFLNYSENQEVIMDDIKGRYPFPVEIIPLQFTTRDCLIHTSRRRVIVDTLSAYRRFLSVENDSMIETLSPNQLQDKANDICRHLIQHADHILSKYVAMDYDDPMPIHLPVDIVILEITKNVSNWKPFRDIGITTQDFSLVLMGDLMEEAIKILMNAP